MLQSWVEAGFAPETFWQMTPRLYLATMRGAYRRIERDHTQSAWLAWHIEALHRQKKLPDAKTFISGKAGQPAKQSPEVLQAMCDALAAVWGAKRS